ncbi:MAG TPA: MGMT family protein [Acidobacteriota bacterium]|nr:MGMT family protein [Acidobacteriota bacterium]
MRTAARGAYERIYAAVKRIPRGRVSTYGDIAALAGLPGHARQVGYALHALRDASRVPWHRVVNAQGGISTGRGVAGGQIPQRFRLEKEGIRFGANGRIPLARYRWPARSRPARGGTR